MTSSWQPGAYGVETTAFALLSEAQERARSCQEDLASRATGSVPCHWVSLRPHR